MTLLKGYESKTPIQERSVDTTIGQRRAEANINTGSPVYKKDKISILLKVVVVILVLSNLARK